MHRQLIDLTKKLKYAKQRVWEKNAVVKRVSKRFSVLWYVLLSGKTYTNFSQVHVGQSIGEHVHL